LSGDHYTPAIVVIPYTIKKIGIEGFGVVAVAQVVILYHRLLIGI
jgi:O-antigen/teichoic acid export membrane protein